MKYFLLFLSLSSVQSCSTLTNEPRTIVLVDSLDQIPAFIRECKPVYRYTVKVSGTVALEDSDIQDGFKSSAVAAKHHSNFILYSKDHEDIQKIHRGIVYNCPEKFLTPYQDRKLASF